MKCPHCGKEIRQNKAYFCPHCGQRLDGVTLTPDGGKKMPAAGPATMPMPGNRQPAAEGAAPRPQTPPAPAMPQASVPTPPPEQPPQRKRSGCGPAVLFLVVAVVIVVAAVFWFLGQSGKEEELPQTSSVSEPTSTPLPAESGSTLTSPTAAPSLPPIPTVGPTPIPTVAPTATPTVTPEPTALPVLPGLEVQPNEVPDASENKILRVTTESSRLNMRSGPGTDYEVVGQADHDALVTKVGSLAEDQGWIVIASNGVYGWVSAQYLSPAA